MTARTNSPFGRPLTEADADRIIRNPGMGWNLDDIEEARDMRAQALRAGLAPVLPVVPPALLQRRARAQGVILGLLLAILAYVAASLIAAAIEASWPVACDGTAALTSCAIRIMGAG